MLKRQIKQSFCIINRDYKSKFISGYLVEKNGHLKSYFRRFFSNSFNFHQLHNNAYCFHRLYSNYWDYSKEYGPDHWQETWQLKKYQSPINIVTQNVEYDDTLKSLTLIKKPIKIHARNLGFNISFLADNIRELVLRGGPLKYNYAFRELHFHWGEVHNNHCNKGCEHTIDGKRYAAELHAVHWNTDLYETDADAFKYKDGLTVLGAMIDASDLFEPNKEFNLITEMFKKVLYPHEQSILNVSPYFLFPTSNERYYTYSGSLTIPPLSENVTWVLFPDPIRISLDQLKNLNIAHSVQQESHDKARHVTAEHDSTGKVFVKNTCLFGSAYKW